MASRNLTVKFKSLRDNYHGKRRRALPSSATGTGRGRESMGVGSVEMGGGGKGFQPLQGGNDEDDDDYLQAANSLPPFWVDTVDDINSLISDIQKNIERLHEAHKRRLMVRFDDQESAQDREIDILTRQITSKFREAESHLKLLSQKSGTAEDASVRMNIQRSVATKLQNLSLSFRKSQKEYLSRLRQQKTGGFGFDDDEEAQQRGGSGSGGGSAAAKKKEKMGLTEQEVLVLESAEMNVQERDGEIQKIAQSIEELSTIFKELAVMVIDQGTVLDRIDYNMQNVNELVQKGNVELDKAAKYQKSKRPIYCIAFLVTMIIIFVIILVVKHS